MATVTDATELESAFAALARDGFAVLPDVLSPRR